MTTHTPPATPRVLTIAGTDPTGGAGAQADIKSIAANGGFALSVITALVSQNTCGVREVFYPPVATVTSQLAAVTDDVQIDAVKIGMLGRTDYIEAVAAWLDEVRPPIVVLDPVMVSTSGHRLLEPDAEAALIRTLPRATVITPNIPELEVIAGLPVGTLTTFYDTLEQARALAARFGVTVLLKAGHLSDPTVRNALAGPEGMIAHAASPRSASPNTHGTGCSISSALATRLAAGDSPQRALTTVTDWIYGAIVAGGDLHVGGGHGPIHHMHAVASLADAGRTAVLPWSVLTDTKAPSYDAVRAAFAEPGGAADYLAERGLITEGVDAEVAPTGPWTDLLWRAGTSIYQQILELPFIHTLAEGTLPLWKFVAYQRQDGLYLDAYARSLARLAVAADDAGRPADATHWRSGVTDIEQVERALHAQSLAAGSGNDPQVARAVALEPRLALAPTMPMTDVTAGYTTFLSAHSVESYPVAASSVLPCYWLYQQIGAHLLTAARPDHPYRDWIATYGSPEFDHATAASIRIVEEQLAGATPEERAAAVAAYLEACRWEKEFFSQADRLYL